MRKDIEKLIQQSKDQTFLVGVKKRRSAVKELAEIGAPQVVLPLVDALKDEDAEVKRYAFNGLCDLRDPVSQEVLRNLFLKTKNRALLQIIKKGKMFPDDISEKFSFLSMMGLKDDILEMVNEENFEEILDRIIESDIDNKFELISIILPRGGDDVEMKIIKRFVETQNDDLFEIIEANQWYPPRLDQKMMFLLKTGRYNKVSEMLDGEKFREVLGILVNKRFPLKEQLQECLQQITNPIIIDEICQVYLRERDAYLGQLLIKNSWSPNTPRDKIFFYIMTGYLNDFFKKQKVDPKMLAGYLMIPHVKRVLDDSDLTHISNFLSIIASQKASGEKLSVEDDNPLKDVGIEVTQYLDSPKDPDIIKEICEEFLQTNNEFLGYLIVKKDWAAGDAKERVPMYLLSKQDSKVLEMGGEAVDTLYSIVKSDSYNEIMKERAKEVLKQINTQDAIDNVFNIYFETADKDLEVIIKQKDWKPSDKSKLALYFVLSGQSDRYNEVEKGTFEVILEAYTNSTFTQRYKLLEVMIESRSEILLDFMLFLFTHEKNQKILQLLSKAIVIFFDVIYHRVQEMIPSLDEIALREVATALAEIKKDRSSELLYQTALKEKGYTAMWILKLLEEIRWQPVDPSEKAFYYELYNIRDEIYRVLEERLEDEDPDIRRNTVLTYGKIGDERVIPHLMKLVDDGSDEVQKAVAFAMGKLCVKSPAKAVKQIESYRIGSVYMHFNDVRRAFMTDSDEQQVEVLKRNYEVGSKIVRIFSIVVLAELKKMQALPVLQAAIQDDHPFIRKIAYEGLAQLPVPENAEILYPKLEREDNEGRALIVKALSRTINDELLDKVENRVKAGEYTHPNTLISLLGNSKPEKYADLFKRIIKSPSYGADAKGAAIIGLSHVKDEETGYYLISNCKKIIDTYSSPIEILPYIEAYRIMGAGSAYKTLSDILTVGNWEMRRNVIRAMADIPERIAMVTIIKAMDDNNGWVQMEAVDSLNKFYNQHFKFQENENDLKFIGAIIMRLKNFQLNELIDKEFPIYQLFIRFNIMMLKYELTKLFIYGKKLLQGAPRMDKIKPAPVKIEVPGKTPLSRGRTASFISRRPAQGKAVVPGKPAPPVKPGEQKQQTQQPQPQAKQVKSQPAPQAGKAIIKDKTTHGRIIDGKVKKTPLKIDPNPK